MSAPAPGSVDRPPFPLQRVLLVVLTLLALGLAWAGVHQRTAHDPWYRNADGDIHAMVNALALNSDVAPGRIDQPAFTTQYLLALDYRVRHFTGLLPDWNLRKFGRSEEPLRQMPALIQLGRAHSRMLVVFVILSAAVLTWRITRNVEASCLAVALLCGSAGVLYHALLNRPELVCAWFGTLLTPFCLWQSATARSARANQLWLFLAGTASGLALLTQLPGAIYLLSSYAWCWLVALLDRKAVATDAPAAPSFWSGLPAIAAGLLLCLLARLAASPSGPLSASAMWRIQALALGVGLLPLLAFWNATRHRGSFLLDRARELALLAGGAVAALLLAYTALRVVLSGPVAGEYFSRLLEFLFHPDARLASAPRAAREILLFVKESPLLLAGAAGLAAVVCGSAAVPARLKALVVLLLANGFALLLLLSRQGFLESAGVFLQLPLLWLLALASAALGIWRTPERTEEGVHWAVPVVLAASLVFLLTSPFRLAPKYPSAPATAQPLPVDDLTLTYLFDHTAHPERYRQLMWDRYGSRENFAQALERFLANPAYRD